MHYFYYITVVVFEIFIQNRYKLNKRYRKLLEAVKRDPENHELQAELAKAKARILHFTYNNLRCMVSSTQTALILHIKEFVVINSCLYLLLFRLSAVLCRAPVKVKCMNKKEASVLNVMRS